MTDEIRIKHLPEYVQFQYRRLRSLQGADENFFADEILNSLELVFLKTKEEMIRSDKNA